MVEQRVCLDMPDWKPTFSVSMVLIGFLSFFLSEQEVEYGSILSSEAERRALAAESRAANAHHLEFAKLFPDLVSSSSVVEVTAGPSRPVLRSTLDRPADANIVTGPIPNIEANDAENPLVKWYMETAANTMEQQDEQGSAAADDPHQQRDGTTTTTATNANTNHATTTTTDNNNRLVSSPSILGWWLYFKGALHPLADHLCCRGFAADPDGWRYFPGASGCDPHHAHYLPRWWAGGATLDSLLEVAPRCSSLDHCTVFEWTLRCCAYLEFVPGFHWRGREIH